MMIPYIPPDPHFQEPATNHEEFGDRSGLIYDHELDIEAIQRRPEKRATWDEDPLEQQVSNAHFILCNHGNCRLEL